VAVDPKVIPLGSIILIEFKNPEYAMYNGFYTARDTGGAVSGKIIDFFMGDFSKNEPDKRVSNFGRTKAKVTIIKRGE
jgi:3D (Asp-Asp-Asp) domain-containing protein